MLQTLRKPFQGNPPSRPLAPLGSQPPWPSVFKGIQGCSLPPLKPFKPSKCSKPSASLSKAALQAGPLHLLAASHHGHLFLRAFKAAVCPPSNHSNPSNPQNPQNPQNAPNPPHAFPRQPSKQAPCTSWQPATTAICF